MSVMACDRKDCRNIMCNRLILEYSRYICDTCFDELEEHYKSRTFSLKGQIRTMIEAFMLSPPGSYSRQSVDPETVEREFRRLTGS